MNINCVQCYEKSFASHERSKFWSIKNIIHPRLVFKSSGVKYLFDCVDCNRDYETRPCDISNGYWCGCQKNKTQTKLRNFLQSKYPDVVHEKKFEWCRNIHCLRFDFFIESLKLIIELDGLQHFKQVSTWTSPEKNQQRDTFKMDLAYKHGYTVIRILQEDVFYDRTDWKNELLSAIKSYDNPCRIFIGSLYESVPMYHVLPVIDS